jgi:hypothetical protein
MESICTPGNQNQPTLNTANGFNTTPLIDVIVGDLTRLTVFWCRATSNAQAAPSVSPSGAGASGTRDHSHAYISVWRGCIATGNPWDVTATSSNATASTSVSAPAVTTTVADCAVLNIITRDNDSAAAAFSAWANASLAGYAELADTGTANGNGGGIGLASGTRATAGAVVAAAATCSASVARASATIALKPPLATNPGAFFGMF